jgi:hypothetical protein
MASRLVRPLTETPAPLTAPTEPPQPVPQNLGVATPRGVGQRPRMSPTAAAAFAAFVDPARARAAIEGRTLVYTVRWSDPAS